MAGGSRSQSFRSARDAKRLIASLLEKQTVLQAILAKDLEEQVSLETNIQSFRLNHDRLAREAFPLLAKRNQLRLEIEAIRKDRKYRRMWTSWSGTPTAEGERLIDARDSQLSEIDSRLADLAEVPRGTSDDKVVRAFNLFGSDPSCVATPFSYPIRKCSQRLTDVLRRIQMTNRALDQVLVNLQQAQAKLEQLEARERKRDEQKAVLAKAKGKSREQADAVKKRLARTDECPYCGCSLGEQPHADHIYPQSKGGLSTLKNMVYVCQQCNSLKSDLTLISFIEIFKLDRTRIEVTLRSLGKDF
jgi:5-methylcytosine-specific restriction endonuclease McrA